MPSRTALISIHPKHVAKILSGDKRLEFRRRWAAQPVDRILIYSTAPIGQLVAVAKIRQTIIDSPSKLWMVAQKAGGGLTRRELLDYLDGAKSAVGLELSSVRKLGAGIAPSAIFRSFHAPQSFRYLTPREETRLNQIMEI